MTEAEANQDGYTTTATDNTERISSNETAKALFVNNKPDTSSDDPPDNPSNNPSNHPTNDVTSTGDHTNYGIWITLVILSAIIILCIVFFSNKTRLFRLNGRHFR